MWDLSSPIREGVHALCSRRAWSLNRWTTSEFPDWGIVDWSKLEGRRSRSGFLGWILLGEEQLAAKHETGATWVFLPDRPSPSLWSHIYVLTVCDNTSCFPYLHTPDLSFCHHTSRFQFAFCKPESSTADPEEQIYFGSQILEYFPRTLGFTCVMVLRTRHRRCFLYSGARHTLVTNWLPSHIMKKDSARLGR